MPSKEMEGWASVCKLVLMTVSLWGFCVSVCAADERVKHMCLCGGLPF